MDDSDNRASEPEEGKRCDMIVQYLTSVILLLHECCSLVSVKYMHAFRIVFFFQLHQRLKFSHVLTKDTLRFVV